MRQADPGPLRPGDEWQLGSVAARRQRHHRPSLRRRLAPHREDLPRVGATNVSWVWCPYVNNGQLPFTNFYPGDHWVDWLALDGFNWGEPTSWQTFPKIFDAPIASWQDCPQADHDRRDRLRRIRGRQGELAAPRPWPPAAPPEAGQSGGLVRRRPTAPTFASTARRRPWMRFEPGSARRLLGRQQLRSARSPCGRRPWREQLREAPTRRARLRLLAALRCFLAPAGAAKRPIALGVYLPDQWKDPSLIDAYAKQVGRSPAIILSYKRWDVKPFYKPELDQIAKRGALPMVSWEPWSSSGKPAKLWAIAAGPLRRLRPSLGGDGQGVGKADHVALRPGDERQLGALGAQSRRQHPALVHPRLAAPGQRLPQVGADNVTWVWCPNINTGHLPFMQYYPGDSWVDWVGLDGFNWGGSIGWRPFSEIFGGSYEELARRTSKPIVIAETGSGQTGGDKAAWVTSALSRELPYFGRVRAVVWYNAFDRSDFRIDSSPSALRAFRRGIARPCTRRPAVQLIATPLHLPGGVVEPDPVPDAGFGQPPCWNGSGRKLHDRLGGAVWPLFAGVRACRPRRGCLRVKRWRPRSAAARLLAEQAAAAVICFHHERSADPLLPRGQRRPGRPSSRSLRRASMPSCAFSCAAATGRRRSRRRWPGARDADPRRHL